MLSIPFVLHILLFNYSIYNLQSVCQKNNIVATKTHEMAIRTISDSYFMLVILFEMTFNIFKIGF